MSLVEQGFHNVLALRAFQNATGVGKFRSIDLFLRGYDLLNEYDRLDVELPTGPTPNSVADEGDWCRGARLRTRVGSTDIARAFATSSARYYAYLRARRFLDFSTAQSEVTRRLRENVQFKQKLAATVGRVVVDEVQDINPVQDSLIRAMVNDSGHLTAVGDHRQAIYSFRGGRIDLMGELYAELENSTDGYVQQLRANYRSTPRIIDLSNHWSATIRDRAGMANPSMAHRRDTRQDTSDQHVAHVHFETREDEAAWIAETISTLVRTDEQPPVGACHDQRTDSRGLTLRDVAILVRSSTDIRKYQDALEQRGIAAVVRGGPDLFSQPEVLLFLGALGVCAGLDDFIGATWDRRSMPGRISEVLNTGTTPREVVVAACGELVRRGIGIPVGADERLLTLCRAIRHRLESDARQAEDISSLKNSPACRRWLRRMRQPRRIFPQTLFHWLLREAGVHSWKAVGSRNTVENALFHVGQLSSLIKGLETAGWTPANSLKWQVIALTNWGAGAARAAETPLLSSPDAVTVTTIHSAKGLEFAAVFVADICARRFPSNRAKTHVHVPFGAEAEIETSSLSDNSNYDNERRLLYVALTRAERYLYLSASGDSKSRFFNEVGGLVSDVRGTNAEGELDIRSSVAYAPSAGSREDRIATNFSDLRYFLECPQDYYLRNVLGFNPTIGQEFGYGRGLHNLLRVVHENPREWSAMATDPRRLKEAVARCVDRGLFYLRYTVGDPLDNLRRRAITVVTEYIQAYAYELKHLCFEPEKEFETFIPEESMLVSGAIDVVRLDDPPRVSIVDFKSGDATNDTGSGLSRDLMKLQLAIYGLAARAELEYEPQQGLIRYVGESDPKLRELRVDLREDHLADVRQVIRDTGKSIRNRDFNRGPNDQVQDRCRECDFLDICPRPDAADARRQVG